MKKNTFVKATLRDMKDTKGKILSIFIMIFLASAVIVGLVLTGPSMRKTLSLTLKKYDHPDLTLTSTYGLDSEDTVIIEKDKDIDHVYYSKLYDGFLDDKLIRIKSYSKDTPKVKLTKGDFPKNDKEIVLDSKLKDDYKIGDKIKFKATGDDKIDDYLKNSTYEIVGFAKSSEYLFQDIRDLSYTGKKMTDGFALISYDDFKKDTLGQANIYYKGTGKKDLLSKEYVDFVKDKKKKMEDSLVQRPEEALKKIKDDANKELDDSEEKIDKSQKELNDKEKELANAKKSLEDGFAQYEKGKKEFYDKISQGEKELADTKLQIDNGEKKLSDGKVQYQNSLNDFNKQIKEKQDPINAGRAELVQGQKDLDKGWASYKENLAKVEAGFADQKTQLDLLGQSLNSDKEELDLSKSALEESQANLSDLEASLETMEPTSRDYQSTLDQIEIEKSKLEKLKTDFDLKAKAYEEKSYQYEEGKKQYDYAFAEATKPLDQVKEDLEKNQALLDSKKNELGQGQALLDENKKSGQAKLDQAKKELETQEAKLIDGKNKYQDGLRELENNKIQGEDKLKSSYSELMDNLDKYKDGKKEFDEKVPDAKKDIEDGKKEIKDQRKKLLNLKKPVYDVGYNKDNKAIKTYYQNSLNIDELSKVFPTFFYFVAILVTLTTMRRYIEEQRSHVGTLKSLGYTNRDIANKFYLYGLLPTFFGAIFGSIFGKFVLTSVIFKAYSTAFDVMSLQLIDSLPIIVSTIALSMGLIYLTIFLTNRKSVNEVTANLLRGKAPKKGSRIFLEKVDFIWKRLSFMQKVTFRNIFRYKSRMYMTLFGVAGCTALLFFGFAMQDAIKDTSSLQRNEITHYDAIVVYDNKADSKDLDSYIKTMGDFQSTKIIYQQGEVLADDKNMDVNLMAFEDTKKVKDFISIRDTKKNPLEVEKSGAIITENMSKKNNLKVGDSLEFEDENNNVEKLKITGIAENYLEDYIYISKEEYSKLFDANEDYNANLVVAKTDDDIKNLEKEKAVLTIVKPNSMYETIDVLMYNLNLVIVIITLVSSILAIVVLFNLTNINVSERMRELATTKVLGFYPKETTAYIYRETMILTLIGVIFGYGLGYIMFRYVLDVVAPEGILIAYHPHPRSFIISAFITFLISLVIMVIVHRRLKSIDMAEAMKSGE